MQIKNKNEQLQRVLVEKESTLLEVQNQNAKLTNELKNEREQKELLQAKLHALESYTTDLQMKFDNIQH